MMMNIVGLPSALEALSPSTQPEAGSSSDTLQVVKCNIEEVEN